MDISKNKIILLLSVIILISLGFKFYFLDFSVPVHSDALEYTIHAISIADGQFLQHPQRHSGWPILASPFTLFVNSENFIDYSNMMRLLGIAVSSVTIIAVYFLGKRFFDEKYSLIAATIFAFEPRLNQISGMGVSEPLFHLVFILSFYFSLGKNSISLLLSFAFAAVLWWIRPNGIMMILALIIIYLVNNRKSLKTLKNLTIYTVVFILLVSPMLIQRDLQFGSPTYSWLGERIWIGDYASSRSENIDSRNFSPIDFIEINGIDSFISKFLGNGIYNVLAVLVLMHIPLVVLSPVGMLLSLKKLYLENVRTIWILCIVGIGMMIIPFSVVPDKRLLLFLFPILIIFSIFTIKMFSSKISTFKNSVKFNNLFFLIIIFSIILISTPFTLRYEVPDSTLEHEKMEFTKYLENNFKGALLFEPSTTQIYFNHPSILEPPSLFKDIRITEDWEHPKLFFTFPESNISRITIHGDNLEELIQNGEKHGLTLLMATREGTSFYPFIDELYSEYDYPYLKKIFDSDEMNFEKFHVKVFEIDYEKFHQSVTVP